MKQKPVVLTGKFATPADVKRAQAIMNFDVQEVRITDKKGGYLGHVEWDESVGGYRFKTSTIIQFSADDLRDISDEMYKMQAQRELND